MALVSAGSGQPSASGVEAEAPPGLKRSAQAAGLDDQIEAPTSFLLFEDKDVPLQSDPLYLPAGSMVARKVHNLDVLGVRIGVISPDAHIALQELAEAAQAAAAPSGRSLSAAAAFAKGLRKQAEMLKAKEIARVHGPLASGNPANAGSSVDESKKETPHEESGLPKEKAFPDKTSNETLVPKEKPPADEKTKNRTLHGESGLPEEKSAAHETNNNEPVHEEAGLPRTPIPKPAEVPGKVAPEDIETASQATPAKPKPAAGDPAAVPPQPTKGTGLEDVGERTATKEPLETPEDFPAPPDKKAETPHQEEKAMTMEKLDGDAKETKEAENPHPEKKAETAQTLDGDTKETKEAETPHQEEKANKAEKLDGDAKKEPEAKADPEVLNAMPKSESRKTDLEKEKKLANPKTKSEKALLEQEAAKQRLVIEENRKIAQEKKAEKAKAEPKASNAREQKKTQEKASAKTKVKPQGKAKK